MRVYKFYPARWGSEALLKRRLKVSPIDELNDPFEYLAIDQSERSVRNWAKEFRKQIGEKNGIISFSRQWSQPLLWAHYADSHRGLALGFDVPDCLLFQIDYVTKRIRPDTGIDQCPQKMNDLISRLLRTKHKEWSYEDEVRLMRPLASCISEETRYFARFGDQTELREVIIGARYQSCELVDLTSMLVSEGVKIKTARAQFKGFRMTEQKMDKLQRSL